MVCSEVPFCADIFSVVKKKSEILFALKKIVYGNYNAYCVTEFLLSIRICTLLNKYFAASKGNLKACKIKIRKIMLLINGLTLQAATELVFLRIHSHLMFIFYGDSTSILFVGLVACSAGNLAKKETLKIRGIWLLFMMYCETYCKIKIM